MTQSSSSSGLTIAATAAVTLVGVATAGALGYYAGKYVTDLQTSNKEGAQQSSHGTTSNKTRVTSFCDVKVEDSNSLVDMRIDKIRPLVPPACLLEELPNIGQCASTVTQGRLGVANILHGLDDRLVVIVGPCSIHDTKAAMEYARKLQKLHLELASELHIIMRVYFEKPRTTIGWKGLINDPDLNGTFNINKGLRLARKLLVDLNTLGLPVGCEFLDTISPQFTTDLVSWGAIGARTTECQLHRELSSGLSMPIGFKNGTGGALKVAVDAVVCANNPHCFLSVSIQGLSAIVNTTGNETCHVILRGGSTGPNYEQEHIEELSAMLKKASVHDKIMVDCSHGNSRKKHTNQPIVAEEVGRQIAAGDERIFGVMIESNLKAGNQSLVPGQPLEYGKSITDACIDWDTTETVLKQLALAVRARRSKVV